MVFGNLGHWPDRWHLNRVQSFKHKSWDYYFLLLLLLRRRLSVFLYLNEPIGPKLGSWK